MYCYMCKKVSLDIHEVLKRQDAEPDTTPQDHAPSFSVLQKSAKHGCNLCVLLVLCIKDQIGEGRVLALPPEQQSMTYRVDVYYAAKQRYIDAVTFYLGYNPDPMQIRNFEESFRLEPLQSPGLSHPNC